jgi:hypothetical protein
MSRGHCHSPLFRVFEYWNIYTGGRKVQIEDQVKEAFKKALVSTVAANSNTTRETIIGMVFEFLDHCMAELIDGGSLAVEPAPNGESHMDVFFAPLKH